MDIGYHITNNTADVKGGCSLPDSMWRLQVGSPGEVVDRAAVLVLPDGGDGPGVEGVDGADPALVRAERQQTLLLGVPRQGSDLGTATMARLLGTKSK